MIFTFINYSVVISGRVYIVSSTGMAQGALLTMKTLNLASNHR
jgi:hypothetical protein